MLKSRVNRTKTTSHKNQSSPAAAKTIKRRKTTLRHPKKHTSRGFSTGKSQIAQRFDGFKDSIFTKMTVMAVQNNAVNLGQGAPDEEPEDFIKQAGADAMMTPHHQYQRSQGAVPLTKSLAKIYSKQFNRELDPLKNIAVGVGATEVGYTAFNTLVNPGDKVVLFEPFFDCYDAWTKIVGAKAAYVPLKHYSKQTNPCIGTDHNDENGPTFEKDGILRSDDYTFDTEVLAEALKDARIVLLNNPHNPLGKIFKQKELEFIAHHVRKNPNLLVISDEVYEFLSHDQTGIEYDVRGVENVNKQQQQQQKQQPTTEMTSPFTRFANLPDMFDRTLTISSAGKTFNITGWKIGWCIGPPELVQPISVGHQWISFSVAAPLQHALAQIIDKSQENGYFQRLSKHYTNKRDLLYKGLFKAGLNPIFPSAGYFVVCEGDGLVSKFGLDVKKTDPNDLGIALATKLTTDVGVTSIPVSEFYSNQHKTMGNTLLRFAYCKKIDVIEKGIEKLNDWNQKQ